MPRAPILPLVDWRKIFFGSLEFPQWLESAEHSANRDEMVRQLDVTFIEPVVQGTLLGLKRPVHIVAFAEDWCGDVVRHVPVLERLAGISENVITRYVARASHPEVFARFLTNGGEAIPKFVFLNHDFTECGNWGPMPGRCREIIARGKACGDVGAARAKVSALYHADTNRKEVVDELLALIVLASSTEP